MTGNRTPLTPDKGEDVPSQDGDEIETAFRRASASWNRAALATIHRTMEGLRRDWQDAGAAWGELGIEHEQTKVALREATSRAEQAEAAVRERDERIARLIDDLDARSVVGVRVESSEVVWAAAAKLARAALSGLPEPFHFVSPQGTTPEEGSEGDEPLRVDVR